MSDEISLTELQGQLSEIASSKVREILDAERYKSKIEDIEKTIDNINKTLKKGEQKIDRLCNGVECITKVNTQINRIDRYISDLSDKFSELGDLTDRFSELGDNIKKIRGNVDDLKSELDKRVPKTTLCKSSECKGFVPVGAKFCPWCGTKYKWIKKKIEDDL